MTEIAQAIGTYNDQRASLAATRAKAYTKQNFIMAGLAFGLFAIAFYVFRSGSVGGAVAVVFIGVIVLGVVFAVLRGSADGPGIALQRTMREQVFPALFSDVEQLSFQADTKGFYDEIPDALKPGGDRFGWGDLIEGTYQGQPIAINEVSVSKTIERDDKTETIQVFKGIAIRTELDRSVPELIVSKGRLAVARWISEKLGTRGDTPHVAFEDQEFEAAFDVHSGNEDFARAVFSGEGRAQFIQLQSAHAKGQLQMAATDTVAYLLVEHDRDFFELPPLDRPFNEGTDGRRLQDEMRGFLELIGSVRAMLAGGANAQFRL